MGTARLVADAEAEQAWVLAETALTVAHAALDQADVADVASTRAGELACEALGAAPASPRPRTTRDQGANRP